MFFIPIFSKYLLGDLPSEAFNRSCCCKALLLDDSGIPGYTSDLSYFFTVELNLFYILVLPYLRHMQPEACNFIKKETLAQVFFCEFCKILKNTFFYRTPLENFFFIENGKIWYLARFNLFMMSQRMDKENIKFKHSHNK